MKKRLFIILLCFYLTAGTSHAQTVGLFTQSAGSLDGYVLFAPIASTTTFLIDKCGYLVHSWSSAYQTGQSVYILENGILLRPGLTNNTVFTGGGGGGIIEKYDWNSNVLWSYTISDSNQCQHHDVRQLPNGNVLVIVWEKKTYAEAIAAGRNPALLGAAVFSEKLVELQPVGTDSANIVWEWHMWDHLVQDYDATKNNYGNVSLHPELLNLNFVAGMPGATDWLHVNAIDYHAALD
ncbi:MAG: aryl-sulfate sulfotransferase, partial [Bacteroidota bacterium]